MNITAYWQISNITKLDSESRWLTLADGKIIAQVIQKKKGPALARIIVTDAEGKQKYEKVGPEFTNLRLAEDFLEKRFI